jgi:phage baseplate assembly protein gpV
MSNEFGYQGAENPGDSAGEYGAQSFLVRQILSRVATTTLVKIVAVTNDGTLSPVGFVDVQPLVNLMDGARKCYPHGVVHHLPYFRLQGGSNAIVIDPQVGDIGIAVFSSHDISTVKSTRAQANPGSARRFRMADGLYIGGVLNGAPVQYVQFTADGITLHSPTKITISAPDVTINGATTINGSLSQGTGTEGGGATMAGPVNVAGDVVAGGKSLTTHKHGGVQAGSGTTGAPA